MIVNTLETFARVTPSSRTLAHSGTLTSAEAGDAILQAALTLDFVLHNGALDSLVHRAMEALALIQSKHELHSPPIEMELSGP
jgi:hypothetical protein